MKAVHVYLTFDSNCKKLLIFKGNTQSSLWSFEPSRSWWAIL